jgi:hypothetical protein
VVLFCVSFPVHLLSVGVNLSVKLDSCLMELKLLQRQLVKTKDLDVYNHANIWDGSVWE